MGKQRIAIITPGTRGDVQPMLGFGKGLQQAGFDVTVVAGSNFEAFVTDAGIGFHALPMDVQELMSSQHAQSWTQGSENPVDELRHMSAFINSLLPDIIPTISQIVPDYDVVMSNFVSLGIVDAYANYHNKQHIHIALQPFNATREGWASLASVRPRAKSRFNYWMMKMTHNIMWNFFKGGTNLAYSELGLPPIKRSAYIDRWQSIETLNAFSPTIVPQPSDWTDNIHLTGYWFYGDTDDYTPSAELQTFLDAGDAPIYLGFGSMSNRNPEPVAEAFLEALQHTHQRGLIISGWSGWDSINVPEHVMVIDGAPHHWLFPRMKGIFHHGGAGTTASALRSGIPQTIIGHMNEQMYWGRRIHELGIGDKESHRKDLSADVFTKAIEVMDTSQVRDTAKQIGEQVRREHGVAEAVRVMQRLLNA